MFCYKCGKEIDDEAVVCIHCGVATKNNNPTNREPIIINNSASASAVATGLRRKKHSLVLDIILTFVTGGLWLIWVLIRPKYE